MRLSACKQLTDSSLRNHRMCRQNGRDCPECMNELEKPAEELGLPWRLEHYGLVYFSLAFQLLVFPFKSLLYSLVRKILKDFIYFFLERGEGREKEGERNIDVRKKR